MPLLKYDFPEPVRWTVEELREACVYLYGPHWRKALAEDAGVARATVNSWCALKAPVPFVVRKYVLLQIQVHAILTQTQVIPYSVH